jgi:hypothetical protein
MPPKRKPTTRNKGRATPRRPRPRRQSHAIELPLRQGLLEMATIGAQSFLWVVLAAATVAAVAGAAFAVWSQRPVPAYSSEAVEVGSPFDVTFRIENTSPWFALANLNISCALTYAGALDSPPIKASDVRFPAGTPTTLGPGEAASFKCPFAAALRGTTSDELGVATRSEIYFRTEYDLPGIGSFRLTDNRGPFFLNTKLLPPRWTGSRPVAGSDR